MGIKGESVEQGDEDAVALGRHGMEAPPFVGTGGFEGLAVFFSPSLLSGDDVESGHSGGGTGAAGSRECSRGAGVVVRALGTFFKPREEVSRSKYIVGRVDLHG